VGYSTCEVLLFNFILFSALLRSSVNINDVFFPSSTVTLLVGLQVVGVVGYPIFTLKLIVPLFPVTIAMAPAIISKHKDRIKFSVFILSNFSYLFKRFKFCLCENTTFTHKLKSFA